jgi:23S rRNA (adenine1618-N6)-methyltransferase
MLKKKRDHPKEKSGLHPRNKHRERYNFNELTKTCPELGPFVRLNEYDDDSIDFFNADAVLMLNKALLKHYYGINYWTIPAGYLCPPIPGWADYIHHVAELLGSSYQDKIPIGNQVKCLDIGVGANCIYPIIGNKEYGWSFVGTDIEPAAIKSASEIIKMNSLLKGKVELRLQSNAMNIFHGVIYPNERFDLTICNPPFHSSLKEAQSGTLRKLSNLNHKRITKVKLNFGGKNKELWCEGGEGAFVQKMISQSKEFSLSCFWFSTLISKQSNLKNIYKALNDSKAVDVKTISMTQGNKTSRIVAWTYLTKGQQEEWVRARWQRITK